MQFRECTFAALLKASLSGYGIEEPKSVIGALSSPVITSDQLSAEVHCYWHESETTLNYGERSQLRFTNLVGQILDDIKMIRQEKEVTALLMDGYVLMGKTEYVSVYLSQVRHKELISADRLHPLKLSNLRTDSAIITYTNDRNSFASIIRSLVLLNNRTFN